MTLALLFILVKQLSKIGVKDNSLIFKKQSVKALVELNGFLLEKSKDPSIKNGLAKIYL